MQPSTYQRAILNALTSSQQNILVQACAGSGKTTTLKLICEALPRGLSVLALSFNKLNAEQFAEKLPSNVDSRTIHSLGYRIIREHTPGAEVDGNKQKRILDTILGVRGRRSETQQHLATVISRIAPLIMANMANYRDLAVVTALLDTFIPGWTWNVMITDVLYPLIEYIEAGRRDRVNISFDDMVDHVVHFGLRPRTFYDVILGDEVQDWNIQQAKFVELISTPAAAPATVDTALLSFLSAGGVKLSPALATTMRSTRSRIILVGDRKQAIYGWRGADTRSMDNLQRLFDCAEYPLSVCYRCPTRVVAEAQAIVGPDFIQPREGAPEGTVVRNAVKDLQPALLALPDGALVVCRTNAPLVMAAFKLIKAKRPAVVRGRDIAAGLIALIKRFEGTAENLQHFMLMLDGWVHEQVRKLVGKGEDAAAMLLRDQFDCIRTVASEVEQVSEIRHWLEDLFSDDLPGRGVVLSSIHKAKGLEEDVVMFLGPEEIPHYMALRNGDPDMIEQEWNLKYVAVTRPKKVLIYQPLLGRYSPQAVSAPVGGDDGISF